LGSSRSGAPCGLRAARFALAATSPPNPTSALTATRLQVRRRCDRIAVSSITGTVNGIVNPSFTYDANGNLTAGLGRTVTWTSYNMVATVARGANTLAFTYDSDHQRIKQYVSGTDERTIYINGAVRAEKLVNGTTGNLIR